MARQFDIREKRPLLLLFSLTVIFTVCSSDEKGKTDITSNLEETVKKLSKDDFGEKIKELLIKRPERPDSSDYDVEFKHFFEELDSLADKMPDDFEFEVKLHGPPENHPTYRNRKAMECLRDGNQFKHFMQHVHEVLKELKDEYVDDLKDSIETDDKLKSKDNDVKINDSENNSTDDSRDLDTTTTESPGYTRDINDDQQRTFRRRRDTKDDSLDLDEILDRLKDDDVECLIGFVSEGDKKFLCHRFTDRSAGIFVKIMAAGASCDDYLDNDDDDDDDKDDMDLNESQQMAIFKIFKEKESKEISDDDVKKLLRLAPDVIDDDFLEDLPEALFKQNLHRLGKLALGHTTNPRLRFAIRKRLDDLDLTKLSSDDFKEIGPGLLSLNLDQIQKLSGKLLLESQIDDDDDSHEHTEEKKERSKHRDDDEDDDDVKRAIGLRVKEEIRHSGLQKHLIGRSLRYLHHDISFVQTVEPDDLFDALDDIKDIDYDFDDAQLVLHRLTQSDRFPPVAMLSGQNLTHMGNLLRGMNLELMSKLMKESLDDAMDDINDIDFDDNQAHQLLENLGYTELKKFDDFDELKIKKLGTLFRGMPAENIALMKDDVIEKALDDLDDLDLSDAIKKVIVEKTRHENKLSPKFLGLKSFAEVISLDDLDDFDDDDLKLYLNASSQISWRLPQAALLAQRYKMAKGIGRMRPSNLAQMKHFALGLLPDDLDEMITTQDDVFDVAEELKDLHEDLISGQIDELTEKFIELSGLDEKSVVIDESEAMQAAHVLAYLSPKLFDKLEFTNAGKVAFIYQIAKISNHKMSRQHLQFLAEKMLEMLEDTDSNESKNDKSENRDSRRLRTLGQIALGLTLSQIKAFHGKAIIDNLGFLRNLAFNKEQAEAVLERIETVAENWKCDSNILARVGPLLQYLNDPFSDDCDDKFDSDKLDTLLAVVKDVEKRREAIQKRLDEGFGKEDVFDDVFDDVRDNKLVNAVVAASTLKINVRTRRAASGPVNCEILIRLGKSARHVDVQYLITISNEEIKRCLPQLGAIGGWSQEVVTLLADKVKAIYGDVSSWSGKTIAAVSSIIAGLSPAEIKTLKGLRGVDVMNSVGKHKRLSNDQLKAGFRQWMELNKKTDPLSITGSELSSLSEFVCGLEAGEISRLHDTTFKKSLNTIGQSKSCNHEQRQAYLMKAQKVYGSQIDQWTPAIIGDMGYLLASFTGDQIKMLNSKQLALISPKIIQAFSKDGLTGLSVTQLKSFSTNQANALTVEQYQTLTAEQQKVVQSKASIDFNKSTKTNGNKGKDNAAQVATYYGFLITTTVLLASMFM